MGKFATLVGILALAAVAAVGTAADAAQVQGKIRSPDPTGRQLTLDNGITLVLPAELDVQRAMLRAGATVTVVYEERNGAGVATHVQAARQARRNCRHTKGGGPGSRVSAVSSRPPCRGRASRGP